MIRAAGKVGNRGNYGEAAKGATDAALLDSHYVKTWVKRRDVELKRDKANNAHSTYQKATELLGDSAL
ncbi:hypothetical protein PAAG_11661 [Paracoccidioides lutzii Pb01]|uniref:Uncharacterized protein n=1 Tax=Paracoccidioides lutzii (strain ATCC MYA-826 / Pb01) TaxID=502779 RepID=A0A0A2V2J0_PARBA|nr:hypothetical protein PAAG_11661 [Paracoccidioides lutzii Pb01]KGQ01668.1 hypothetical protein PAAG_11661 [Paracoccidioides lutzii Pb01]